MNNFLKYITVFFGYLISLYFLFLFFEGFEISVLKDQLELRKNLINYLSAMGIFLVSLYFRALRWEVLVYGEVLSKSKRSFNNYIIYLVSDGLNNILPLRIGDFYRITATRKESKVSIGKLLILLIFERVFDLIILLSSGSLVLFYLYRNGDIQINNLYIFEWVFTNKYILLIASLLVLVLIYFFSRSYLFKSKIYSVVKGFKNENHLLGRISSYTLATWFFEFTVFVVLFNTLPINFSLTEMFSVFITSTLSTLIPSAPGYIGTFHFVSSQTLNLFNVNNFTAGFFAIISHLVLVIPTIFISIFYLNISLINIIKKGLRNTYE